MDSSSSGPCGKLRPSASAPQVPLDGVASLEEEAILVLQGNQDAMATRDPWVWTANPDFQAPRGKRVHQETLAPGGIKGKMELLGLLDPPDHLGPEALLATLGKMAPGDLKAQWVPKESLDKTGKWALKDPQGPRVSPAFPERRGMMGCPASRDSLGSQGPRASQGMWGPKERTAWTVPQDLRGSLATEAQTEPPGPGVPQASRASKETLW